MEPENLAESIGAHLGEAGRAPYLFVGSGISRRYLNTPDWRGLLNLFANRLGKSANYYLSKANDDYPLAAGMVADDFFELWWHDDEYAEQREAVGDRVGKRSDPFKYHAAHLLEETVLAIDFESHPLRHEMDLLRGITADGVITTNWDSLMETLFPEFSVYVGQDELLFSNPQGIAEIYKIHGSVADPRTLVATREDYDAYEEKNAYLAAKLLSTFLEHPIVFVGYGVGDPNIVAMLESIVQCMSNEHIEKLRDQLILVQWSPEEDTYDLTRRDLQLGSVVLPIVAVTLSEFSPLYRGMSQTERRVPAKLMRLLKERIYEVVRDNDPTDCIYAADIEDAEDLGSADVLLGIGLRARLTEAEKFNYGASLKKDDVIAQYLAEDGALNAGLYLTEAVPRLSTSSVPVFRYLHEAGYSIDDEGNWSPDLADPVADAVSRLATRLQDDSGYAQYRTKARRFVEDGLDFEALVAEGDATALYHGPFMPWSLFDADHLLAFLRRIGDRCFEDGTEMNALHLTQRARLVCIHDALAYGPLVGFSFDQSGAEDVLSA